ncbi:MAG TPA: hypothetical protein VMT61_09710 [Candidatus Binataceae bacterium]|nr:hypothetical protein [Candidatus Binataceae bacterium]
MNNGKRIFLWLLGLTLAVLLNSSARADTLTLITDQTNQKSDDSIDWSQLGADATVLNASFSANTALNNGVSVALKGSNSLTSVVCTATPCSWGTGFTAGDTLLWTSDNANGGNGPLTLTFATPVFGAGALIKADLPGQFTAQIQARQNGKVLKSFTEKSDTAGDPIYIGVLDSTAANITGVVFSLSSCPKFSSCADFAVDKVQVNQTSH